ncbi:hypothetical protein TNCV_3937201 [Trichonephila clavipes]|nr:hypothetical protein TNCV_3937201 [Trichonephila clavipes]
MTQSEALGLTRRVRVLGQTGLWRASHHQEPGNYLEGRPAQPPRVGGAFEKSIDGGLNLLWLTWCGS